MRYDVQIWMGYLCSSLCVHHNLISSPKLSLDSGDLKKCNYHLSFYWAMTHYSGKMEIIIIVITEIFQYLWSYFTTWPKRAYLWKASEYTVGFLHSGSLLCLVHKHSSCDWCCYLYFPPWEAWWPAMLTLTYQFTSDTIYIYTYFQEEICSWMQSLRNTPFLLREKLNNKNMLNKRSELMSKCVQVGMADHQEMQGRKYK